jgi:hypothetical protein
MSIAIALLSLMLVGSGLSRTATSPSPHVEQDVLPQGFPDTLFHVQHQYI